jgi:hypothetical protein
MRFGSNKITVALLIFEELCSYLFFSLYLCGITAGTHKKTTNMKQLFFCMLAAALLFAAPAKAWKGTSPNGRLTMDVTNGRLALKCAGQKVMDIVIDRKATAPASVKARRISEEYAMLAGKRLHCTNEGNEYRAGGMTFRLYNDGLAFRYETSIPMEKEPTAYILREGMKRWMQQWSDGYEGFFPLSTTYKEKPVPSFSGVSKSAEGWNNRWGYPALIEASASQSGEPVYVLITEANIEQGQSASCLFNDGERFSVVADKRDEQGKPWPGHTPWRVAIVGTLPEVVQSTLVTDVSEPSRIADTSWIKPGVVSWVYWAYNHGSNDYSIIKKYVDMAVALRLPYVLIDAEWDEMNKLASNEGKTVEDAVKYALSQGVKPLIWYNSSVGWVNGAPGPKYRLNKPEDREKEFAWCEKIGVVGVKIDFFSGDTQLNMDYCQDLLESAARHHLLVNFHGATVPRGWQRTWPNLMSTEGVYGAEWYNNVATFTQKAAAHNATLPFTRNVIGPMDYTPCAFSDSQHPHITTHAHELALTVLFESALQHLADRPESFLSQPAEVQRFLGRLPSVWDETRLVGGYPGEYAVMARRSGNTWYVAGINGEDNAKTIALDLSFMGKPATVLSFQDATTDGNDKWNIATLTSLPTSISCNPRGGFVLVIQ